MTDKFNFKQFITENRLGPFNKLNEGFETSPREEEEEAELGRITDAVHRVFAKDHLTSQKTVDELAEDIRNEWSSSRGYGRGDELDFTEEYLMDWVSEARSGGGGPGLGGGSKLSRGDNDTIWGDNWENIIMQACKPEASLTKEDDSTQDQPRDIEADIKAVLDVYTTVDNLHKQGIIEDEEFRDIIKGIHPAVKRLRKLQ